MGYVTIKEATEQKLHFAREPTTRSWAILIGLLSLGLGAAYYSYDYIWWKLAYISGAVFVGLTSMEDWEECILDKDTKKVTIKRQNLLQKLFQAAEGSKLVVADLDDVMSVTVQEEEVKYSGVGYVVVLNFGAGYSLGITETTSNDGDKSEQEYIAEKINSFLELEPVSDSDIPITRMEAPTDNIQEAGAAEPSPLVTSSHGDDLKEMGGSASLYDDDEEQSSTDESDDSFEQIDKTELANFNETQGDYHGNQTPGDYHGNQEEAIVEENSTDEPTQNKE